MKIIPLALLLFIGTVNQAFCPNDQIIFIPETKSITVITPIPVNNYGPLIDAMFQFEAGRNTLAYNPRENAVGGLQIRQAKLDDYNKCTGKNYTLNDMYDFNKAQEVFMYFTNHTLNGKPIPNKSWEQAAKDWNGSGKMTVTYWEEGVRPLIKV
jgi:hypothetical protein